MVGGAVRRMCEGNEFLKMIDICELVHLAILLILSLLSYPLSDPLPHTVLSTISPGLSFTASLAAAAAAGENGTLYAISK